MGRPAWQGHALQVPCPLHAPQHPEQARQQMMVLGTLTCSGHPPSNGCWLAWRRLTLRVKRLPLSQVRILFFLPALPMPMLAEWDLLVQV